jgi:hypothetical protein
MGTHSHSEVLMFGATLSQVFIVTTHFLVGSHCLRVRLFRDLFVSGLECFRALLSLGQTVQERIVHGRIVWGRIVPVSKTASCCC